MIAFEDVDTAIKSVLPSFSNKEYFSFIGFIGSLNIQNDLDLLFLPRESVSLGKFFISIVKFFDALQQELAKRNFGLVVFTYQRWEEETKYLARYNAEKDALIHVVTHVDWEFPPLKVKRVLLEAIHKTSVTYVGNAKEVVALRSLKYDPFYVYLFPNICFHARYPLKLEYAKIRQTARYIMKHSELRISCEGKSGKELFFELCESVDAMLDKKRE